MVFAQRPRWTLKVFYRRIGLPRGFLGCRSVNETQQLCKQAVNACQMNIYVAAATSTVASFTFLSRTAEICRGIEVINHPLPASHC